VYSALNQKSKENLIYAFEKHGHNPSSNQFAGVLAIPETLTRMLSGTAESKYYLSSLDPGMGKSTAVISWLLAYLENRINCKQGVLICLERLEEIERYVDEANIPEDSYAVIVSEYEERGRELNQRGVGSDNSTDAIVLFTTKAQIKIRCSGRDFVSASSLYYRGKPRTIKVWDESFSVGRDVVLNPYDFGKLLAGLGDRDRNLPTLVSDIISDIVNCKAGDIYSFPLLPLTRAELLHTIKWKNDTERDLADLLGQLSWQPVTIREYKGKQVVVDCVQAIPDDFLPCLIMDASGRVKGSYLLQHKYRKNIVHLTTPDQYKSYRNLTVNVWRRSSSKIALINDQDEVALELSKVIAGRPTEDFIILCYKSQTNLINAVLKQLPQEDQIRVKLLTWGKHTAVNTFRDIPNCIIISPYYYRDYHYEALTRAAAMSRTSMGNMSQEEISRVRKGEIAHNLLQGCLRGSGRISEGDTCPESRLWLIAAPTTGIEKELTTIFPDCKVETWITENSVLTPHQQKAIDFLLEMNSQGLDEVSAIVVMEHLGIKKACNFKRGLLDHQTFHAALATIGIRAVKRGKPWNFIRIR